MSARLCGLLGLLISLFGAASILAQAPTQVLAQAVAEKKPVVLTGGTGVSRTWARDPVPFWVTIRNDGDGPLRALRLHSLSTNVEIQVVCYAVSMAGATDCTPVPQEIVAGDHVTLRGTLIPLSSGEYRPVLLFSWMATNSRTRSAALELGTVSAESYVASWASAVAGLVQGLTLPIVLAILGYMYQRRLQTEQDKTRRQEADIERNRREQEAELERERQKQREELEQSRQAQERQIEQSRKEREVEQARIAQTLNLMLPISHHYASKHYTRLEVSARCLIENVKSYRSQPTEKDSEEGLYHLVRLYKRMRILTETQGGFYFKDRIGEEIVATAWDAYDRSLFENHKESGFAMSAILDEITKFPQMTLATFVNLMTKSVSDSTSGIGSSLTTLSTRFRDWMTSTDADEGIEYLRIFRLVLNHEMNKPYEYWYGDAGVLPDDASLAQMLLVLERTAVSRGKPELNEKFQQYLRRNLSSGG